MNCTLRMLAITTLLFAAVCNEGAASETGPTWYGIRPVWNQHRPPAPPSTPFLTYTDIDRLQAHPCIDLVAAFTLRRLALVDSKDQEIAVTAAEATVNLVAALSPVEDAAATPHSIGSFALRAGMVERLGFPASGELPALRQRIPFVSVPGAPADAPTHQDEAIEIAVVLSEDFLWFEGLPDIALFRTSYAPSADKARQGILSPPYVLMRLSGASEHCRQAVNAVESHLVNHPSGQAFRMHELRAL